MSGWIDEAKGAPLLDVALALGLDTSRNAFGPCPFCSSDKRSREDTRKPCTADRSNPRWWCVVCDKSRDTVDLVAGSLVGHSLAEAGSEQINAVRRWFADRGWVTPLSGDRLPTWKPDPSKKIDPPRPPPAPEEVKKFLRSCTRIENSERKVVLEFLNKRGIDSQKLKDVVVVAPENGPWPNWWWYGATYPVVVAAYDGKGAIKSLHGRSLIEGDKSQKTRWPIGAGSAGYLFANRAGVALLRGQGTEAGQVLIAEGFTDFCAAVAASFDTPRMVLGGTSGSWKHLSDIQWPPQTTVYAATDNDETGDAYAEEIRTLLAGKATFRRLRVTV